MEKTESVNLTDNFIEGIYKLSQQDFPDTVIKQAKKCLLDYLGVTFAGAVISKEKSKAILEVIENQGNTKVIGLGKTTSLQNAILLNGIHAHVVELDDGHRIAMMHPGAPIISALLPVVQQKNISGETFLKAIIIGYETSVRLACTLQPSLKDKGFHGTGITGSIGAAIAVATALGFNKQQLKDTLSAAATSASGILKVIKDISELKPYNVGNAAQSGYIAAMLAYSGFKGPYDIFEGKLGFLSMMSENYKPNYLEFNSDDSLSIMGIYRKPYAACRHCHPAVEAALILKNKYKIDYQKIESVLVNTYFWGVGGHDHTDIVGVNSAKMSTPYSVAVALVKSKAGLAEFSEEAVLEKDTLTLTKKITVVEDAKLTALVPKMRVALVQLKTTDGNIYSEKVDYPKGEPENPISDEELEDKFISLAQFAGKSDTDSLAVIQIVNNLEAECEKLFQYL